MMPCKNLLKSQSGAALLPIGIAFMLLVMVVGVTVDISRGFLAKGNAQSSVDAATIGAVASHGKLGSNAHNPNMGSLQQEFKKLFYANYTGGGEVIDLEIEAETRRTDYPSSDAVKSLPNQASDEAKGRGRPDTVYTGVYHGHARIRLPNMIMGVFGQEYTEISANSEVTNTLDEMQTKVEISLVLDTTGSMDGQPMIDLRAASHIIIDRIFNGEVQLDNLHFSIVPWTVCTKPFDVARFRNFVKSEWQDRYDYVENNFGSACIANRNEDMPMSGHDDTYEGPPISEQTRFRTPNRILPDPAINYNPRYTELWGFDLEDTALAPIMFAENSQAALHAHVDTLGLGYGGYTRMNVGLMWGWYTLSQLWQGVMDPAKPNMPRDYDPLNMKFMVAMTDGNNTLYAAHLGDVSNDNANTLLMCNAIKARGIRLFVVTMGNGPNLTLAGQCASPNSHLHTPTSQGLQQAFTIIAELIREEMLRFSGGI